MDDPTQLNPDRARRLVQAAAWRTHLTGLGVDSNADFEAWLATDARNAAAWRQIQMPWEFFGEHATSPELMQVRRRALGRAHTAARRRWHQSVLPAVPARSIVAAAAILTTVVALILLNIARGDLYQTTSAERRIVMLSDGSKLTLDAQTEVRVRFSRNARELELVKGQARFDVSHDVQRPFSVHAGAETIVATGTAFNVDLIGAKLIVTLIEGRVVVLQESSARGSDSLTQFLPTPFARERRGPKGTGRPAQGIELSPGQELVVSGKASVDVATADIERVTAWQNGQIVFDNEPLSSVIAHINRYSSKPITIEDTTLADLKISGVFNTDDIHRFITTITSYLPVSADEEVDTIRLRSRAVAGSPL